MTGKQIQKGIFNLSLEMLYVIGYHGLRFMFDDTKIVFVNNDIIALPWLTNGFVDVWSDLELLIV